MQHPDFWKDQNKAKGTSLELDILETKLKDWSKLQSETADLEALAGLNERENDSKLEKEIETKLGNLKKEYSVFRLRTFLSEKYDDHNCLLSIHAGAGGTDAQDWAGMLLRMYLRYAEKKGYKVEVLDKSDGSEAGIKSVVLLITGTYAFGYMKAEAGVHRLIRLSPFNPSQTRETSFALVEVLPELESHEELELDPNDLKIETSTSQGAGGQSVNTTYSAVRITHVPTGLKVSIQNERSQHQNKAKALKILQSKLRAHEEQKQREEKLKIRGEFHSAEWGNQIRSYTVHPYKLVKDHRTGLEKTDPEAVLDGDLDDFIAAYLEVSNSKNQKSNLK
ncbi:MAG: peptide chain release factor 2 [Candidatus Doudnabacteria bacterium RIFCSPHIGHO2_01_FULL_43_23]|uniref:Peptide chain release factor 2 n=1 Tax=Candidatus Doudnabacteria bacterium RIFCSPHIGHO2_01_FULL_43_23 TaxID=1817822 RepID=A0A1F5NSK8_9BACT|nr:MAG: peptide chain release factor 2 [Candidatus Doudnabacteria bacterium RIFCSPHIGHO2_01_FULL_43_23]